jgi:aspartate/methionine/tyrosine aminotransferase
MKHHSVYLDWYVRMPKLKYDLRSSGLSSFSYDANLRGVDLSINYVHGNPETTRLLAERYRVKPENVFVSSEGASGQNARIIRVLAEHLGGKNEALVEFPTYEPLLRQVQEHFRTVRRFERKEEERFSLNLEAINQAITHRTGLLVLTNPHAPSGASANRRELAELMQLANEHDFFVVCDEIYAEFNRALSPPLFSISSERAIVTTSFTKAYGLGGLKLGAALAAKELVDEFYTDVLNTVGNSPNIVQHIGAELLSTHWDRLEEHKQKWAPLRKQTEEWLNEMRLEFFPNKLGVTYWIRTPIKDTHKWTTELTIPRFCLATVPGSFFLFKKGYRLTRSNMVRVGLGNINPEAENLARALNRLKSAVDAAKSAHTSS